MNNNYRSFFGLKKEPFGSDLKTSEILETDELKAVTKRLDYAVRLGGAALVTGEIGSGKSTALRYASEKLHPSEYETFYVTATSGSILELYRQIAAEMGIYQSSNSKAVMTQLIKNEIKELVDGKKMKIVLIIDEASLLRMEVLAELHTLCQFHKDSKPWLPLVLAGQSTLIDKMMYRASAPLASRIIARSHMEGLDRQAMLQYLEHHLSLAGVKTNLFEDAAITAIHQGSGGLLRKANHLARGSLIAAASQESMAVSAEHVRLAATEIF
ncbi:MAG: AAA family ATPase [Deltaproteobacteria bacterium]|nr:AAA family ATPase [Deltaproteobacteria bacterium]